MRVPEPKTAKMAAMTSSNLNFQNRRKNLVYLICGKFHQNRSTRLGCRDNTDRHTDTHTHRDTDIIFPTFRFQTCHISLSRRQHGLGQCPCFQQSCLWSMFGFLVESCNKTNIYIYVKKYTEVMRKLTKKIK